MLGLKLSISSSQVLYKKIVTLEIEFDEDLILDSLLIPW